MALSPTQKTPAQRKELLAAIDSLAKRGGISRDRALAAWYASTLLGIDEDEAIDAASVDGPEDAGCDFIYIDDDQQTIYILQGYVSERADKSAGLKKWNALVGAVASVKDPIMFQYAGRNDIYDRLTEGDTDGYSMVFGLVTLAAKSDLISRNREATVRSRSYGDVSFFYEYQDTLYDKYLVVKAADRNVPQDSLQFNGGIAELRGEFGYSIVGSVYAGELFRLYSQYDNQLFEGNVRLFIGQRKGGINEKIVETAENRHGDFWALNNGITIVADSFEEIAANKYTIRSFSIVNGCQTTVSLSKAIENSPNAGQSQVLVRVVAAKKALLTDIVRYNNTQNPVKLAAVRLLDPIQESLRTTFSTIDYTYAPKQEGARVMKNSKRIELDKAAQYLAAMSDDTILEAVTRKMELFDRFYKMVFPRGLTAEKVFLAWLIAHEVEVERAVLLNAAGVPDDKVMKVILGIHGTPWGIFVTNFLIDRLGTDVSKLTLSKMVGDDFKNAVGKYSRKAMEFYSEIAVSIVSSDDEAASVRNEIRVKPFLDKLKRTLALKLNNSARWKLPRLHNISN
ncbi:AIPR family protein [Pseudomonas sp. S5F11]|uniref:AIPR family protein n=1 Tax=Pseudomonas sp. S5F11 TaxID=2866385 RepID=UPI001C7E1BC7|nr:AIPR family protein [Pseudomonas sp. S5F11]MBX4138986.1 AIPR family protein [Pseudomonas sp. S5F11]